MNRRLFVLFFAAATGYVSLTQEMLWMRAVSHMTGGEPATFAHVLGFFLLGVAAGALFGERVCERRFSGDGKRSPVRFIGLMLLISAAFYYLSVALVARLITWSGPLGMIAVNAVVIVVSFLLGGVFPVLCHYGARAGEAVGTTVSRIYVANIVGSTLGPLLTGFVLMQYLPTDRIILYLSIATAVLGGIAFLFDERPAPLPVAALFKCAALVAGMALLHGTLYNHLLERLHFKERYATDPAFGPYRIVVENRSGIISIGHGRDGRDPIWGGGVYDGVFNTDPTYRSDINFIKRAYLMACLHRKPEDVLCVGVSSGSWAAVAARHDDVKKLVCVEINPGYLDIFREHADLYPEQAALLTDPKVEMIIDDGRRWLNRHPDRKFDFMLQNTTWHWRSHATNLLSREYLELCKSRLKPGGIVYYNATYSDDAFYTAAHVFKYVTKYGYFVAASDSPFDQTPQERLANVLKFRNASGTPIINPSDPKWQDVLYDERVGLVTAPLHNRAPEYLARRDLLLITDDNMAPEFKRARKAEEDLGPDIDRARWRDKDRSWAAFFRRRASGS